MSRRLCILTLGAVLAGLTLVAPLTHAQGDPPGVNPTHYWTYHPTQGGHYQSQFVMARDQFLLGPTPIYLDSLLRLVNWVRKNNSAVPDTFIHYSWWNIQNKMPNGASAIITNQFGQYPVQINDLDFMLVPAWKNVPQPGHPQANHYLCYKAQGGPPPGVYHFEDEWRVDNLPVGPLEYLCAPCEKNHNGQIFPILDEVTHLALYPVPAFSERFFPFMQDQFFSGICDVQQYPMEYLMVPTLKQLIPTNTQTSTWGKLKTLYR